MPPATGCAPSTECGSWCAPPARRSSSVPIGMLPPCPKMTVHPRHCPLSPRQSPNVQNPALITTGRRVRITSPFPLLGPTYWCAAHIPTQKGPGRVSTVTHHQRLPAAPAAVTPRPRRRPLRRRGPGVQLRHRRRRRGDRPLVRRADRTRAGHESSPQRGVINAWWAAWLLAAYISNIAGRLLFRAEEPEALAAASRFDVVSIGLTMIAAVLAIAVIRKITDAQEQQVRAAPVAYTQPAY
ncbi:hypothetical protein C1J01_25490 [Nonomuraea aridisoli]|uniref:DUF4328 domain-containing protein n=1 Tax=Nonomuraea aridisoli TaxID=2070368 RepID=A0A2W2EMZ0_9ACTN|nr:hypothetical protein C1J01_25490 [Nonomuraea aridisoli]